MLQWFLRFSEFAEFTEFKESSALFRENLIESHVTCRKVAVAIASCERTFTITRKSSCGKSQEAYRPRHNPVQAYPTGKGWGGAYLGQGGRYLPWPGLPTLAGGTYLGWGYLSWLGGTYLGHGVPTLAGGGTYPSWGYLPWLGVPALARGTYLGQGVRTMAWGGVST